MSLRVLSKLALAAATVVAFTALTTSCNRAWDELKGKVAFTDRGSDGVSALYMSDANGHNKTLLFHNNDPTNSNILSPEWSEDNSKILFTAMKNGSWRQMAIDPATLAVTDSPGQPELTSRLSRAEDLVVEKGSLYYAKKDGTRTELYRFRNYDSKFNTGVSEASWSPNRTHAIFQVCTLITGCKVHIARGDGSRDFYVASGASPAWTDLYKAPAPVDHAEYVADPHAEPAKH